MTQPAKVTEPSMEEILASIRRIIADDEAKPPPAETAKPAPAAAAPTPKPQAMNDIPPSKVAAKPSAEKPAAEKPAPPPAAKPAPAPPPPSYAPVDFDAPPVPPQQPILAQSTVSAVESAFNSLAHTVLSSNARTLEDLVKEMLRPMLKSWLDDNLPGLVERIVKAEIERVSRGGR